MNATELTLALNGRWQRDYGMSKCPAHPDRTPSLRIEDGDKGVLVFCYSGCTQSEVIGALKCKGLWPSADDRREYTPPPKRKLDDSRGRTEAALAIWREARPGANTLVETYLRHRGITIPVPPTIKYHASLKHAATGLLLPAMVGAVQGPDRRITAIYRTFLRAAGVGKAPVSNCKMALGPIGQGAVRLGPAAPVIGLAEGIETALSVMQLFDITCWAALGSRMAHVELPHETVEVQVFADHGDPGHRAAEQAAQAFTEQGRRVFLRYPPKQLGDWNDALRAQVAA